MLVIDLNCDMGEGFDNDAELMRYISSANIACGFHAGNEITMRQTIDLALKNNVAIGAHPSFADREGYGRRNMILSAGEIYELTQQQVEILNTIIKSAGGKLHHVKPHGALYNMAAKERYMADAIVKATFEFDSSLIIYGMANSEMINAARSAGLGYCSEVFADRTYEPDGSLTPRSQPNALIENTSESIIAAMKMVVENIIVANDGSEIAVQPGTICIHGDSLHALEFAKEISGAFTRRGIHIKAPAKTNGKVDPVN